MLPKSERNANVAEGENDSKVKPLITRSVAARIASMVHHVEESLEGKNTSGAPGKVMGVAVNGKDDERMLQSALQISCSGVIVLTLMFSLARKFNPIVYTRKECLQVELQEDPGGSSMQEPQSFKTPYVTMTDWVWKVWDTTPEDEVSQAGLDGWAFLEFRRMNFRIICIISPVLLAVLLPIHWLASDDSHRELDVLSRLDIGNEPLEDWMLWVHAVLVWFVVVVSTTQLAKAQEQFTERRFQWLKEIPFPRAQSLLVSNIPHMYRTDTALRNYFTSLFSEEDVKSAYVVRRTGRLPQQVKELTVAQTNLERAKKALPDDAEAENAEIERCQQRLQQQAQGVARTQTRVQDAAERGDSLVCSSSGFVTFSSEVVQRLASREQYTREVTEFTMEFPPHPSDVIYSNVADVEFNATTWNWVGVFAMVLLFLLWIPLVVVISGWTTFSAVQDHWPEMKTLVQNHPWVNKLLSGVFATIVLKGFLAFLPTTMYWIIISFVGVKSGSEVQLHMQRWYSCFLIVFVLLVTSMSRGLTITLVAIAQEPGQIFGLLANYLPSASHFYFNYTILGWIVLFSELARSANLWKYNLFRRCGGMTQKEAKAMSEPEDPASYGIGSRMASSLLTSAITFVFCSCSPMVLVFSGISFCLGQLTYGYLLVFGESKKPDTGGQMWLCSVNHLLIVLTLYVVLMTGVLQALGPKGSLGPPLVCMLSCVALYWTKVKMDNLAFDVLPLEEVVRASRARREEKSNSSDGEYKQPELDPDIVRGIA